MSGDQRWDPWAWFRIRRRAQRAFAGRVRAREATERRSLSLTLGLPLPLIIVAFLLAAGWGMLLTYSLGQTTPLADDGDGAAGVDNGAGGSSNLAAPAVITESTLGPEVERLIETGALQSAVDFDVPACLTEQGIDDRVLIMEEIQWGPNRRSAWLIVHSPLSISEIRSGGGSVGTLVVLDSCGTHPEDPAAARIWAGSTALSGSTT